MLYYFDNVKHPLGDGRAGAMRADSRTGVDEYRSLSLRGNPTADQKYEHAFTPEDMNKVNDLRGSIPTSMR